MTRLPLDILRLVAIVSVSINVDALEVRVDGQHRVGILSELPQVLRELGADPDKLIATAHIDPRVFRNPENVLNFWELGRLLEICVTVTGSKHLGLLVGQKSTTNSLGLVGRLMQNSLTLGDAILALCTHQERYERGAVVYLFVQDGVAFFGYAVHLPEVRALEQISDGAIAVGFNLMKELVGLSPREIFTSRSAPMDVTPYSRFFGFLPRFDAEQHALLLPEKLLTTPIPGADPRLREILGNLVARYWAVRRPSVAERVIRIICPRIFFADASLDTVARVLSMHPRTLNRRLEAEGTSFRRLLGQARFEMARQLLVGTNIQVTNIALALGYGDTSSFSHAFQRWSGVAPSQWRTNT